MDFWKQIEVREFAFGHLIIDENTTRIDNGKTRNGAPCYRVHVSRVEGFWGSGGTIAEAIRELATKIHTFAESIHADAAIHVFAEALRTEANT